MSLKGITPISVKLITLTAFANAYFIGSDYFSNALKLAKKGWNLMTNVD